jgi:hypothetical protein
LHTPIAAQPAAEPTTEQREASLMEARPDDHQGAGEADGERAGAPWTEPLAEHPHRAQRPEQRPGEHQGDAVGQHDMRQRPEPREHRS